MEVYSWWEEESERRAFEAVIDIHQSRHENVEVVNLANDEAGETRGFMAERVLAGAPPATFQANLGADLVRWTMVETDDPGDQRVQVMRSRWIRPISNLYNRSELERKLQEGLMSGLEVGDDQYAVPINIHRANVLYYNVAELAAVEERLAESGESRSLLDIDYLCDPESDFDGSDLRIAIGKGQRFTLVLLAFESILPALHGADFYDRLFRGERPPGRPEGVPSEEVREALACVQHLSRWFVPEDIGWAAAVNRVKGIPQEEPTATFTVMGDWANGLLLDDEEQLVVKGVPFTAREGVGETFVYTSDTFPLPLGVAHRNEAEALLETISSRDAQLAFSAEKGSIPARHDVSLDSLPPSRTATRDDYLRGPRVLATSGLFPPYYPITDLERALYEMLGAGDVELERALQVFTDAEPLLSRWQDRISLGAAEPYER